MRQRGRKQRRSSQGEGGSRNYEVEFTCRCAAADEIEQAGLKSRAPKMDRLRPGVGQVGMHARGVCVHFGGVIFEGCARGGIQREGIGMLQEEGVDAEGFSHGFYGVFCMDLTINPESVGSKADSRANILYKMLALFEVVGQSLRCCKGASHAPGF